MTSVLEKRVSKLEEEADRIAIIPSDELMAFFRGERDSSKDHDRFLFLFDGWIQKVVAAIDRKTITLDYLLSVFPHRTREALMDLLRKDVTKVNEDNS